MERIEDTIDRAAEIKRQIKAAEHDLQPLLNVIRLKLGLMKNDAPVIKTEAGNRAQLYDRKMTRWDEEYLTSVLTPEQMARAKKSGATRCLRVDHKKR